MTNEPPLEEIIDKMEATGLDGWIANEFMQRVEIVDIVLTLPFSYVQTAEPEQIRWVVERWRELLGSQE